MTRVRGKDRTKIKKINMDDDEVGGIDETTTDRRQQPLQAQQLPSQTNEQKKLAILSRKTELPQKLRTVIDEAKNYEPAFFLRTIESNLLDLLFENAGVYMLNVEKGLNSDHHRDTFKEIETAIRFFPNVLVRRQFGRFCISFQAMTMRQQCNLKAVSFIPLLAELGIEYGLFTEEQRGGLIDGPGRGRNVLYQLVKNNERTTKKKDDDDDDDNEEDEHQLVDESFLVVMKQLRKMNLFRKEDIQRYNLCEGLCCQDVFPELRFRYVVDWDPNCLMINDHRSGSSSFPMHYATYSIKEIRGFRIVFEVGIQHFPIQIGFLFHKNEIGHTPFRLACDQYGEEKVINILDDGLDNLMIRDHTNNNDQHNNSIRLLKSLINGAADEMVDLDCVYILLRREPAVCSSQTTFVGPKNNKDGDNSQKRKRGDTM